MGRVRVFLFEFKKENGCYRMGIKVLLYDVLREIIFVMLDIVIFWFVDCMGKLEGIFIC